MRSASLRGSPRRRQTCSAIGVAANQASSSAKRLAADFEQVVLGQGLDAVTRMAHGFGAKRRQPRARPLQGARHVRERRAVAGDHKPRLQRFDQGQRGGHLLEGIHAVEFGKDHAEAVLP